MIFASDNWSGASPKVLDAILAAGSGANPAYGADRLTLALQDKLDELFETPVIFRLVPTGTLANALSLSAIASPGSVIFCHDSAHVLADECGAIEAATSGARLEGIPGVAGRLTVEGLKAAIARYPDSGDQRRKSALSLTQATECGTLYTQAAIAERAALAHDAQIQVQMDGARFANAIASLGISPAAMTWKAGVDILAFGGTKNGALMAEAVIAFPSAKLDDLDRRRKRGGSNVSKLAPIAAQFLALLDKSHWLDLAAHANGRAQELGAGFEKAGLRTPWAVEINELFPVLPKALAAKLRASGVKFYDWETSCLPQGFALEADETLCRFVTSFATTREDVSALLARL